MKKKTIREILDKLCDEAIEDYKVMTYYRKELADQAESQIKALMDEGELKKFLKNLIKYEKGKVYYNRKPFNFVSDWFEVRNGTGEIIFTIVQGIKQWWEKK